MKMTKEGIIFTEKEIAKIIKKQMLDKDEKFNHLSAKEKEEIILKAMKDTGFDVKQQQIKAKPIKKKTRKLEIPEPANKNLTN